MTKSRMILTGGVLTRDQRDWGRRWYRVRTLLKGHRKSDAVFGHGQRLTFFSLPVGYHHDDICCVFGIKHPPSHSA